MSERLVDVAVVARVLDVSPETVRRWIRAGKLMAVRLPSGFSKIPISELHRMRESATSATLSR